MSMRTRIMYVECKVGHGGGGGPAWIGRVSFSKSGRTVYYRGRTLERHHGISGNHMDVDSGEEYWISGPKRNRQDRHWAEGGPFEIDPDVREEYERIVGPPHRGSSGVHRTLG